MKFVLESKLVQGDRGEDRVAIERQRDVWVVAVADGAGGTGSGGAAAEFICSRVSEAARSGTRGAESWSKVLRAIDEELVADGLGGEATAVVVEIGDATVCGASVGDTEAWLFSSDQARELTNHQNRKPLIGSARARPCAFGPVDACGRLLIATDGLFGYATPAAIESVVRAGQLGETLTNLAASVALPSGAYRDDVAIVLGEWAS